MALTKNQIKAIIDAENGEGYSNNINLNGYTFIREDSFIVFELKTIDGVKICHIKYISYANEVDLITLMVHCCNFWMGNKVQFIFYKEKEKCHSARKFLENLNFRVEELEEQHWKFDFRCNKEKDHHCKCPVFQFYK